MTWGEFKKIVNEKMPDDAELWFIDCGFDLNGIEVDCSKGQWHVYDTIISGDKLSETDE
jgi:hypothetical protein